ncbi:hypothetical protein BV25DRAFT_1920923 [Artomyces pyxidatus]|uniref:Uncharacterized protein n=1 Tax=Artomyces pyxidatus TaxID=48021 RepID=A0ACB8SJN9_9AGAM|nr:hypothetical protein BV25DRAFT_1920923 [Artomyces pyxidatus]
MDDSGTACSLRLDESPNLRRIHPARSLTSEICLWKNSSATSGGGASHPPPLHEYFLDFLQETPLLETLTLGHCLPSNPPRTSEHMPVAHLPRLAILKLAGKTLRILGPRNYSHAILLQDIEYLYVAMDYAIWTA